ncbi:response regulator receiver domain [Pseudomonas syringae pv. tomato]|uniref:response regulator receiver domain n=1 Tax=Pseudomonas syringae group genomosp. 3 TaxID=251701 RepID=UPI0022A6D920|nr:response regulator receiver domain [Pseudomonas syringae group genomosp. 3]MCZ0950041.1 response regulator receiver domain [Pseudomonas syringae pv. tomato]
MSNVSPEMLKEAFINPIRFALLVDDDFPTYQDMLSPSGGRTFETARASELFEFCRHRGWLCDVDNAASVAIQFEREKSLNQSDLLILDYHLDPGRPDDPSKSISILQDLALSDHFNLVIIYTGADADKVLREVSFCLGGGVGLTPDEETLVKATIEDMEESDYRAAMSTLNIAAIENYLLGLKPNGSSKDLRAVLAKSGVSLRQHNSLINYFCEQYFSNDLEDEVLGRRQEVERIEASLGRETNCSWVSQGNLFAVIVNKTEGADVLEERLHQALVEWSPSPLRVLMVHARASLERAGTISDEKVLDTPRRQAGWLLRILLARSGEETKRYMQELYGRLFERLVSSIEGEMVAFGTRLISLNGEDPVVVATKMSCASGLSREHVYHALNEHLCSDNYKDLVMTTGVVFRALKGAVYYYWLCVSPACDLVPGQNDSGWDGELHPFRPISAVRLTPVKNTAALNDKLKNAEKGRNIFICVDDQPVALEVANEGSRQMLIEIILLANEGAIVQSKFSGFNISKHEGAPSMLPAEFEVVGVLRTDYANKLLADSGHQRSRIGVDFVDLPPH